MSPDRHRDDLTWLGPTIGMAERESGWGITPTTTPAPTGAGLIAHSPSLCPTKHVERVGRWRWRWWCTDSDSDPASGEVLKSGHRPTETWAWTRAEAVANRIHAERLEAER